MEEQTLVSVLAHGARRMGYEVRGAQGSLLGKPDGEVIQLADLGITESVNRFIPRVRVYRRPAGVSEVRPDVLATARAESAAADILFTAFTADGETFDTFLSAGRNESGSLAFLPWPPVGGRTNLLPASITQAQPFTSIAEVRRVVAAVTDRVYKVHGHDRLKLFDTLLLLLAVKIYDELQHPDRLLLSKLLARRTGDLVQRVTEVAHTAVGALGCKKMHVHLSLSDEALHDVLMELSRYSLRTTLSIDSHAEILGTFYQEVVSSTFRGSLGAYFTPKPIADLAAEFCSPAPDDTVFDISCGSGTFLLSAWNAARRASGAQGPVLFGCDIQERMVLTCVLNCALHGVENHQIVHHDGLRLDPRRWRQANPAVPGDGFTLIVGMLPFIERVAGMLAPGGRAALVIPTSVLNGEATPFRSLRRLLADAVHVTAIIGLPRDAFVHTDCGVEGALLVFERPMDKLDSGAQTFFWSLDNVGYDRKGESNPTRHSAERMLEAYSKHDSTAGSWIGTDELYSLDRWDVPWLAAWRSGRLRFSGKSHVRLTDLCRLVNRNLSRSEIDQGTLYRYFEVGDADIDTGAVRETHEARGSEILKKGRLRLKVRNGDVLLPNHRDSLIAKSARGVGRSAVQVGEELEGCITTDRFTVLEALIDPSVLIAILNSRALRSQLAVHARGSASFDIRDKVLGEVWVPRSLVFDDEKVDRIRRLNQMRLELLQRLDSIVHELDAAVESV